MLRATNLSMALLSDLVISEVIVQEHTDNETICWQIPWVCSLHASLDYYAYSITTGVADQAIGLVVVIAQW